MQRYKIYTTLSDDSKSLYPFHLVKYVFFKKKRCIAFKKTLKISASVSLSLSVSRYSRV